MRLLLYNKVCFIEHVNFGSDAIINTVFDNKWIGIIDNFHAKNEFDNPSTEDPASDVSSQQILERSDIKRFNKYFEEECIVVAKYENKDTFLIGLSTNIRGVLCEQSDTIKALDGTLTINYLELKDVEMVSFTEFPMLFLATPKRTFCRWNKYKYAVQEFYQARRERMLPKYNTHYSILSYCQRVTLCEEWLRDNQLLKTKLFISISESSELNIVGINERNELVGAKVAPFSGDEGKKAFINNPIKNKYLFVDWVNDSLKSPMITEISLNRMTNHFDYHFLFRFTFGNDIEQFRMSFSDFLRLYDNPGAVILLTGYQEVANEDKDNVLRLARLLTQRMKLARFRSGDSKGAEYLFSSGVTEIDRTRLEIIVPFETEQHSSVFTDSVISLDRVDIAREQVLLQGKLLVPNLEVIDSLLSGKRTSEYISIEHIIRDMTMSIGNSRLEPATFAIFYDYAGKQFQQNMGYAYKACCRYDIPFVDKDIWLRWLEEAEDYSGDVDSVV
ncbi:MAG: hypothetical protein IPM69_11870 [Ignavibacteria bacterium]|nr:hypothetical protein [Ignavibacteria bacterium]